MTVIHDFRTSLAWSEAQSCEPFWDTVYRKAFPNLVNHMPCLGDTQSQRMGVDRVIHLSNGHTLHVDEKKRREAYDDILLEYAHTNGKPGWMEKDLRIDYLAYAFMPTKQCYLFPWPLLRRAWLQFRDEWKGKHPTIKGKNQTYITLSVAVPIPVLRSAISTAAIIDVSKELADWNSADELELAA